ncbi:hypothetical protein [Streptomyces sp. NPDC001401]
MVTAGGPSRAAAGAVQPSAVPYCAWADRRPGPMRVWIPRS